MSMLWPAIRPRSRGESDCLTVVTVDMLDILIYELFTGLLSIKDLEISFKLAHLKA